MQFALVYHGGGGFTWGDLELVTPLELEALVDQLATQRRKEKESES